MSIIRHFTATGFLVHKNRLALHWHPKVKAWLPPGGHIDDNEDPVQAVLREINEECGIRAKIVPASPLIPFGLEYPIQVQPPVTIMIEDIDDPVVGYHQHIDMIYICQPLSETESLNTDWQWVSKGDLENGVELIGHSGIKEPPPKDVRVLAEHAFKITG